MDNHDERKMNKKKESNYFKILTKLNLKIIIN